MTVVSALITRFCTAHASDSMITELRSDGTYEPIEWERSKIIAVRRWRGAMTYWGVAKFDAYNWSTFDWLTERAYEAPSFSLPEEFANDVAAKLNTALANMQFVNPKAGGIGIHFTAYEYLNDYWIPELFLISNWTNTLYSDVRPEGVGVSRETYHAVMEEPPAEKHRELQYRMKVHDFLQEGKFIVYNNGDPSLFNPAANAILKMFEELARRGRLNAPSEIKTHLAMARRPVEIVSKAQVDFCPEGMRVVGGKPHDLAVTPNGEYRSNTGDG